MGQDCANLPVAGVLLWSALLLRRGSGRALFIWLGCLLYFVYTFTIFAFSVHFNRIFLAYVAVLRASFHAFAGTLVFAVTMGFAILTLLALSAMRGQPVATPAAIVMTVVALSVAYTWNLLHARPPGPVAERRHIR